jgi:hypothetical protein
MTVYFQFPRSPELSRYFRASILQSRATEWQKRIDAGFAHGPGAWDPRKDFSQCMQQSIILSTSNVISFRALAVQTWHEVVAPAS